MAAESVDTQPTELRDVGRTVPEVPSSRVYEVIKRVIDVVGATIALMVALPVMAVTAIAIRFESPGDIFFSHIRLRKGGAPFRFYKLRSMCEEAVELRAVVDGLNEVSGPIFKIRQDPRMTRVGKIIRKTSIDELPQLWHVLTGEMSLVGPRPPVPEEVVKYEPWMLERLSVKPGLTCIWQISGRSNIGFDDWMKLDVEYVHTRSLWLDLKILAKTIPAVITGRGAY